MLKMFAVSLQAVCLCVVVSFFTTEVVNNAKSIVGGCPAGILIPKCTSTTDVSCPSAGGVMCPLTRTDCTSGGSGGCANGEKGCKNDSRCTEAQTCSCVSGS